MFTGLTVFATGVTAFLFMLTCYHSLSLSINEKAPAFIARTWFYLGLGLGICTLDAGSHDRQ